MCLCRISGENWGECGPCELRVCLCRLWQTRPATYRSNVKAGERTRMGRRRRFGRFHNHIRESLKAGKKKVRNTVFNGLEDLVGYIPIIDRPFQCLLYQFASFLRPFVRLQNRPLDRWDPRTTIYKSTFNLFSIKFSLHLSLHLNQANDPQ